jgi:protein-disulfide isomerase
MTASMFKVPLVAALFLAALPAAAQQPGDVAARMGDRTFTVKELDDAWKAADAKSKAEADQAVYDGRKDALDRLVAEMLVERAAKARGVDADKYMADEVAKRVKPVTDAEVEAFFKANTNQMQGRPLTDVSASIRRFLEEQQEEAANTAIIGELRKGAAPVKVQLEPPRVTISIAPHDPARGPATAAVTLVEFSDYQCPFCSRVTPTLKRLRETYGERLRIVWKDFPLYDIHPLAQKAAEAAWCAGDQGKYWEFHERLFVNQGTLGSEGLKQHAAAVGLEPKAFATCLESGRHADRVKEGEGLGRDLGVDSTPTAFINGRRLTGAHPYEAFAEIIDEELSRVAR